MKIVSIVIPAYNMEKYIARCLESLLISNIDDVEILVINDGSRDNTSKIAHCYQEKFPSSIKVVDKANGNYGSCINVGLTLATGKYFRILDSDDYFNKEHFAAYVKALRNIDADVVLTHCTYVYENGKEKSCRLNAHQFGQTMQLDENCCTELVHDFIMHKVTYSLNVLRKTGYRHLEGISYTDSEYVLYPLSFVQTVQCLDLNLYQYCLGRDGQTMSFNHRILHIGDLEKIIMKLLDEFTPNMLPAVRKLQERYIVDQLLGAYYHTLLMLQPLTSQTKLMLQTMDLAVRRKSSDLFQLTNTIKSAGIPYVKIWHKYHISLPISSLYKLAYKCWYNFE